MPTLGGQTGLNLAVELSDLGVLAECGVEVLGTKLSAIQKAEDRDLFRNLMNELNEPVPESEIIHNLEEAMAFTDQIGFPVIVRPAYTLGGTGGGICTNEQELKEIVENGLKLSPVTQCLLEKVSQALKKLNTRSCVTAEIMPLWFVTWKTLILSASTQVTVSLWLQVKR